MQCKKFSELLSNSTFERSKSIAFDFTSAERVRKDLEADGFACWMATRDVRAGADYASAITDAIAAAPLVIVLFSGA